MPATVFPHARLFSDVVLRVENVRVDGELLPSHNIDNDGRIVALFASGRQTWREAEILLRADVPLQELKGKGIDEHSVLTLMRINCDETNLRSGELVQIKNGTAEVKLMLRREHVAERATLECFVVQDSSDGFARILREAAKWAVVLTEPQLRKIPSGRHRGGLQDFVKISWINFAKDALFSGLLGEFSREAYYFDLQSDPPALYLNSGIDGYRALLASESSGTSEAERVFREMEYKRISLAIWLNLCLEAISSIVRDDETGEIVMPHAWRREIIDLILPKIYPGESVDAAARKIVNLKGEGGIVGSISGKLQIAVNEIIASSTTLKKHLYALMKEEK